MQQLNRVVVELLPEGWVHTLKELGRVGVPTPPKVVAELLQKLERRGELRCNRESFEPHLCVLLGEGSSRVCSREVEYERVKLFRIPLSLRPQSGLLGRGSHKLF